MKMTLFVIATFAFLGMVDTLYLSIMRQSGPPPCNITSGCENVLTSKYSKIGFIPLPWIGLAYYLVVFSAAVIQLSGTANTFHLLFLPVTLALATSIVLTGIQAFVLQQYCDYCLGSGFLSAGIFFAVLIGRKKIIKLAIQP